LLNGEEAAKGQDNCSQVCQTGQGQSTCHEGSKEVGNTRKEASSATFNNFLILFIQLQKNTNN